MTVNKKDGQIGNQFPFYEFLKIFYDNNKKKIKRNYKDLTKKFLDYNDKTINPEAYLRKPQFEALEMYVFIKEFLDNKQMYVIFDEWRNKSGKFADSKYYQASYKKGQITLYDSMAEEHETYFKELKKFSSEYPNYIFSLAMGLGKTILMATCIYYEFLLANKYPKDERYCHNALIFAPDLTVLQSLSEIVTFDKTKVIPEEYAKVIDANIKFQYLSENKPINTTDRSDFNIIISNTQKIIVKRKTAEQYYVQKLFTQPGEKVAQDNIILNQRFEKLTRLDQLGVYVDEAHHMFGADLEKALRSKNKNDNTNTSLRNTIDLLSEFIGERNEQNTTNKKRSSGIVSCYNFTGTPYVENSVLPEVVYSYGLKESIQNEYLKEAKVLGYENVKNEDFLRDVIIEKFWKHYGGKTYDGLNPKLAIFGANIDEVENVIKPAVEKILSENGIPISKILVNIEKSKDDEIRLFNNLDKAGTDGNEKQFILLINKGREGWNCKSLFGVALYRKPKKSKVFVLQATMRCLRKITDEQQKALVFLSKDNFDILSDELEKNFRVKIDDLKNDEKPHKKHYQVRVNPPPRKIKVKVIRHEYTCERREYPEKLSFTFDNEYMLKYDAGIYAKELGETSSIKYKNANKIKSNIKFSEIMLVFEISRYLNIKPTIISNILKKSENGMDIILKEVNKNNEIIYDLIIPDIFNTIYEVKSKKITENKELTLLREPKDSGYYVFSAKPELVVKESDKNVEKFRSKSFHADTYCFDSEPEKECFRQYLQSSKVKKVYFTGMFTSSRQGDFSIQYIDPETKSLRNYYPDFLAEMEDGSYRIIEVKADNMFDDLVVQEKKNAAEEIATENSKIKYFMYKSSDIMKKYLLDDNSSSLL